MPNVFDQFDKPKPGNVFDQFDGPSRVNRPRPQQERDLGIMHPEFDASGIPGYDPATGMVEPGANNSWMDKVGAFSSGLLDGVPIAGPYLLEGAQQLAARTNPFSDKDTDQLLYEGRQQADRVQRDNPYTTLAGNVVGATAATLPAVAAAPTAFGAGGGGLAVRMGSSALTGTGIGSVDAAVRTGGDPEAIKLGAGIGGLAGLAGPAAGDMIGAGYRAATNWLAQRGISKLSDLTPPAMQFLTRALEADGLSPQMIQQRLQQLGPDAMIADLGPGTQQLAAGIAALPGEGRSIVHTAMRGRDAGANQRITSMLDDTIGPAPIPSRVDAGIRDNQEALGPAYEQVFQNARAVDTTSLAHNLESAAVNLRGPAQKAARDVRQMLNVIGTDVLDPNPGTLFQTRQAIDGLLSSTTDTNAIRLLTSARRQVDDVLGSSVPGIKEVDAQFAELARQREAVTRGQQVLESGRTAPRPQEFADEFQQGALPQGRQIGPSAVPLRLREGARAEIDRIVGTNANDRAKLARLVGGEGDWNRAKLATAFGEDRARRILDVLEAERVFAETSDFVTRNSFTAARQGAMDDLTGRSASGGMSEVDAYKAGGAMGATRAAGVSAAEKIIEALKTASQEADRASLGRVLTGKNAKVVEALMQNFVPMLPAKTVANVARALMIGTGTTATGR